MKMRCNALRPFFDIIWSIEGGNVSRTPRGLTNAERTSDLLNYAAYGHTLSDSLAA
jgi:hypothetical protein